MAKELVEKETEIVEVHPEGEYLPRMPLEDMKKLLDEELAKRKYLLNFIKKQLIPGIDFGMIHKKKRDKSYCKYKNDEILKDTKGELIWQCPDCKAKYELRKPGAEKICGFLQLKPKFVVDKEAIEALGMQGKGIIYICYLITESGLKANEGYEGRGARTLAQDYGDLNKCVKMAKKSAHIDATLTIKGLSAIFTQDISDIATANPGDWEKPQPEKAETPEAKDGKITKETAEGIVKRMKEKSKKGKEEYDKMKEWCDKNKIKYTDNQLRFFTDLYKSHTVIDDERKTFTNVAKKDGISEAIDKLKALVYNRRDVEKWICKESQCKNIKLSAEILQYITKDEKSRDDLQREAVMIIETYGGKNSKDVNQMLKEKLEV